MNDSTTNTSTTVTTVLTGYIHCQEPESCQKVAREADDRNMSNVRTAFTLASLTM